MRVVENSELSNYKVLPFDLYTENRAKILEAGEVLTPGKLIMLKNYVHVYTEDFVVKTEPIDIKKGENLSPNAKILNFSYDSLDPSDFETVLNRD